MNIAMINKCQRPISFSNGLERDSQQAQCEHVHGFYFSFSFLALFPSRKKVSPAIFSHKISPGLSVKLSPRLWVGFVNK